MSKKEHKSNWIKLIPFIFIFVCGYYFNALVTIPYFTFNKSINGVHLLSIFNTLFVAFILAKTLNKKRNEDRFEKDFLIKKIDSIDQELNEIEKKVRCNEIEYTEAASLIKKLRINSSRIKKYADYLSLKIARDIFDEINNELSNLNKLITDTPRRISEEQLEDVQLPMEVKEGVIYFQRDQVKRVLSSIDKARYNFSSLQLTINRL